MSLATDGPLAPLSSLHTHSRYDDGEGEIGDYAAAASCAGLSAYGASGHAPLPFDCDYAMPLATLDTYCDDVRKVAERWEDRLAVYLGLELDYVPGLSSFYEREFLGRGFDYFVASVHYVGDPGTVPWAYDESEDVFIREIQSRHAGDSRPVVEDYYSRLCAMVREVANWGVPSFVGHFDRIALWNRDDRYFPTSDSWYLALVDEALNAIQSAGMAIELNTSGWTKPAAKPNPNLTVLRRSVERRIPLIVSADAHQASKVARLYREAVELLRKAGYGEVIVPNHTGWRRAVLSAEKGSEAPSA